ncbi:IclR family transcriptional regulator [Halorhabdus amylolytica]|uniref:IclR family transcriptional regulator n=1 Tax=Halorhabdus amylolytica TaxID=2559573 RepID=UPI0010AACA96|nr:helix-turn-helix domain-containing protein [Halorhabdus amylolytica]
MLKSDEKLFRILELLLEKGQAGVTELAEETPYHKSTVYTHLQTMQEKGLVFKSDSKYQLSLKLLTIGERIKHQQPVYRHGYKEINSLANETGELVYLAVPENDMITIVDYAKGEKTTLSVTVGSRIPIEEHSVGKVILAFRSGGDGSGTRTDQTRSSEVSAASDVKLPEELQRARTSGFVLSKDQRGDGPSIAEPDQSGPRSESHLTEIEHKTVAAPVLEDDEPSAVVAITGPSKRISGDYQEDICQQVIRTAAIIERKLDVGQIPPEVET